MARIPGFDLQLHSLVMAKDAAAFGGFCEEAGVPQTSSLGALPRNANWKLVLDGLPHLGLTKGSLLLQLWSVHFKSMEPPYVPDILLGSAHPAEDSWFMAPLVRS